MTLLQKKFDEQTELDIVEPEDQQEDLVSEADLDKSSLPTQTQNRLAL